MYRKLKAKLLQDVIAVAGTIPWDVVLACFRVSTIICCRMAPAGTSSNYFKFIYNAIIGIILWLLNLVGGLFGIKVAINPVTALIVGFGDSRAHSHFAFAIYTAVKHANIMARKLQIK